MSILLPLLAASAVASPPADGAVFACLMGEKAEGADYDAMPDLDRPLTITVRNLKPLLEDDDENLFLDEADWSVEGEWFRDKPADQINITSYNELAVFGGSYSLYASYPMAPGWVEARAGAIDEPSHQGLCHVTLGWDGDIVDYLKGGQ